MAGIKLEIITDYDPKVEVQLQLNVISGRQACSIDIKVEVVLIVKPIDFILYIKVE
ncbi:hypothetical protein PPACK8108_LOCUS23089 [Phakopsora pachyrhizi]|uniref:Uncharacterized protein n=1 Tax=Phakopsora pachyrhizi TaxID=170000 RepID=A0AAV0BN74_PHAPC|nr:hypothetical protein PPACK8108_LOCUS23089 [Phakopsora pachyrhizi]